MKSPEEQIDKALRDALKRKFDDFESSPEPSLSKKIIRAITEDPGVIQKSLILSLLLLISVIGTLMFTSVSGKIARNAADEKPLKPAIQSMKSNAGSIADSSDPNISSNLPANEISSAAHVQNHKERQDKMERSTGEAAQKEIFVNQQTNVEKRKIQAQTAINQDTNLEYIDNVTVASNIADVEKTISSNEENDALPHLNALENKPFNVSEPKFSRDSIGPFNDFEVSDNTYQKYRWGFIFGVAPLRTFQVLTVAPANNVIYQNFSFPTKISAQTLGFKFTAGVEKNGFQFLVNYGRFRQSFRYEIATDEFVLNPDKPGENKVIRKGTPVEENSLSNLVGLSVKKHYVRRGLFLKNYFGDAGLELNRDLTSKKNMVWVNAGFGKELVVDADTRVVVGPYIEYSFMKLRNDQNQFTVQPYQIGLSVGLKFLKK